MAETPDSKELTPKAWNFGTWNRELVRCRVSGVGCPALVRVLFSGVRALSSAVLCPMRRIERRLFGVNDEIAALEMDERLAEEELVIHRHLDDDTQRDAAVSGNPMDRADARETSGDVRRFELHLAQMRRRRAILEAKRDRLIKRL